MSSLIRRDIHLRRQKREARKQDAPERYLAQIVRFNGNLKVPNRPGYVYVQQIPVADAPPPVPVLCVAVQPRENMRVWVERNREGEWEVVTWWRGVVQQPGYAGFSYLPLHGRDHEWPDKSPRPDVVNVYPRALTMLRSYPGEAGGLTVSVSPLRYILAGAVTVFPGKLGLDISASQPAAGLARYVGIYLDLATNTVASVDGATALDAPAIEPDMPTFPDGCIPSAAVRLDADATTFYERDFLDLRPVLGEAATSAAGDAPAGAQYVVLALDATLTSERVLTAGAGISIVDGGAGGAVTVSATNTGWTLDGDRVIPLGRDLSVVGAVTVPAGITLTIDGELFIL